MKKKKGIEQMDVAEKIRYFRQQKGLSQEQLEKRAGIHEQSIRKYELGVRKPKLDQLKKIVGGLEVSVIEFIDIEIENEADLIAVLKKSIRFLNGKISEEYWNRGRKNDCSLFSGSAGSYGIVFLSIVGCR